MFIFENDFFCTCGFELADLTVDVLLILVGAASGVAVYLQLSELYLRSQIRHEYVVGF